MPEILAPAGNMEMLKAAVINGADAVYLGLNKFSARSKAENFDGENLIEAINYAHLFGVKVYVAINTVIKNDEMADALILAKQAIEYKADALILQDLGLAQLIRKECQHAVLHASTQMGIHNLEGAVVAKKLGFSRIILSRETLIDDIIKIKKSVDIELEFFVQGASCIAFSGNCYFSSFASGFSGNRGKCMQLCRKSYTARFAGKTYRGYLLSAKDLMLVKRVDELVKAGIDCFKIEGRLRRPEYVAESVRIYKNAINGNFDGDIVPLKKVFNRGDYTEGHLYNGTNKVLDTKICSHKGVYFGKVTKVKANTATVDHAINKGDGLKFLRNGIEVGSASVNKNGYETGFAGNIKIGDDVYITTDSEFNKQVLARNKKLPVNIIVDFTTGILSAQCGSLIKTNIENAYPAKSAPVTKDDIRSCFNKSEVFTVDNVDIKGEAFMLKSDLNALRRTAYKLLIQSILEIYHKKMQIFDDSYQTMTDIICSDIDSFLNNKTIYQVENLEQISDDMDVIAINPREYSVEYLSRFSKYYDKSLLSLPIVARGKDIDILKEIIQTCPFKGYIVNNLYGIELVKTYNVLLGYGMNIVNDIVKAPKIYSFESDTLLYDGYIYTKGNVPLMSFCHCEKKELASGCENCNGYDITLSYENRNFYLRRYKIYYCYSQLLNCANLDITNKNIKRKFIDLSYKRANEFTKGNYSRGLK